MQLSLKAVPGSSSRTGIGSLNPTEAEAVLGALGNAEREGSGCGCEGKVHFLGRAVKWGFLCVFGSCEVLEARFQLCHICKTRR